MNFADTIYYYSGSIRSEVAEKILHDVEDLPLHYAVHSALWKRVYIVVVELLSNMERHALTRLDLKEEYIAISKEARSFIVQSGNLIKTSEVEALQKKIRAILEHANYNHLKQYYLDKVVAADISIKGGAGLGLITIAKACRNSFTYEISPLDDEISAFSIKVVLE